VYSVSLAMRPGAWPIQPRRIRDCQYGAFIVYGQ
jgi:hypothetical protein